MAGAEEVKFMSKEKRAKCWLARDQYFACLDANEGSAEACTALQEGFSSSCAQTWVKHFLKMRRQEQFKHNLKGAVDPVDELWAYVYKFE